ncbi:MAG: hypothetical protein ACE366_11905 [Bradymonadia bacterium]
MHRTFRLNTMIALSLAAASLAFTGCDDDSDDGNGSGSGSGSGSPLGSLFGGSSNNSAGNGDGTPAGGGEQQGGGGEAGGEQQGGGDGALSGVQGEPVPVSNESCAVACTGLVQCFASACGFTLSDADVQAAVSECVPECVSAATAEELGAVQTLIANECAEFSTFASQEGLCSDFDEDDFVEPEPVGGGGGGGPVNPGGAADCNALCSTTFRCAPAESADIFGDEAQCVEICTQFIAQDPEAAAEAACITANQNLSCEQIDAACYNDDFGGEDDFDGEDDFGGEDGF